MKFSVMVFSPTGGTGKVTAALTANWGTASSVIDLSDVATDFSAIKFDPSDTVVIAVPSFGGRVPELATKRLSVVQGNGAKAILVCVYGNRAYEDTLVELQDTAESAGFTTVAAVAAVAEHSIAHQIAAHRPDQQDANTLAEFGQKILAKLQSGEACAKPAIPGNRPYRKSMNSGLVPKAGKACTQCGVCAKKCPAGAIDPKNVKSVQKDKCISCMRCVAVCPEKARNLNWLVVKLAGFALKKSCSSRKEYELYL